MEEFKVGSRVMMNMRDREDIFPSLRSYTGTVVDIDGNHLMIQRDFLQRPDLWHCNFWTRKRGGENKCYDLRWRYINGLKAV